MRLIGLSSLAGAFYLFVLCATTAAHTSDDFCVAQGTAYSVSGKLVSAGINAAGVPMYEIEAQICPDTDDLYYVHKVVMYPPKLIPDCKLGDLGHANGKLGFECQEDEMGGLGCLPGLLDATLTCEKK